MACQFEEAHLTEEVQKLTAQVGDCNVGATPLRAADVEAAMEEAAARCEAAMTPLTTLVR